MAMKSEINALLEAALDYAKRGWSIIPVRCDENNGKRAAVRWKNFQMLRATDQVLEGWFADGQYSALAVVLGPVSGQLACRDFDDAKAYEEWAERFPELAEKLPTVRTARGYHVYFTCRDVRTAKFTDGELRGERSYCVLPPSVHPSGTNRGSAKGHRGQSADGAASDGGGFSRLSSRDVKGEAKPWRGAEQKRSAQSYVYPGPPGASIVSSSM